MFSWTWPDWQRRYCLLTDAWNRENPAEQAEPEWVEELSTFWFQRQYFVGPNSARDRLDAVIQYWADRLPRGLVRVITQTTGGWGYGDVGPT